MDYSYSAENTKDKILHKMQIHFLCYPDGEMLLGLPWEEI